MDTAAAIAKPPLVFTGYQKFILGVLAFLQFTIILDFMIISPLGAMMMPTLNISPQQFGWAVSSYAFSAGVSSFLAAGFADRFDRKRLLLFFYCGFMLGTLLCALATTYHMLLIARTVTGLFGGVIGSIVLAIATDLFALEMRGRGSVLCKSLGLARAIFRHSRRRVAGRARHPDVDEAGGGSPGDERGAQSAGASDAHRLGAALLAGFHRGDVAADGRLYADAVRYGVYRQQHRVDVRGVAADLSDHRHLHDLCRPVGRQGQ
jgi:hypothetical protein